MHQLKILAFEHLISYRIVECICHWCQNVKTEYAIN